MIDLKNMDCVEYMKTCKDNEFDLAICDPPYGIEDEISKGGGSHTKSNVKFHQMYSENFKTWDIAPTKEYFDELFRVSKNQIIWGGNYFPELPACRCFICWDKVRYVPNFSMAEYAWTSFDKPAKLFKYCNNAGFILKPADEKIHPTQKPIQLYKYLLTEFAKEGDKILDTHLGAGSIAIAAHYLNFDLTATEIDKQYYDDAVERFNKYTAQTHLF